MIKKVLVIFLLSVFILQFVSAVDTQINIKTISNAEVQVTVTDASSSSFISLGHFKKESGPYGDLSVLYSGDEDKFNLIVIVKKFGKTVYYKQFIENYPAGQAINLKIEPEGYHLVATPNLTIETNNTLELNLTNQTILNNTIKDNITNDSTPLPTTGLAVSNSTSSGNIVYYIGGLIILLLLAFFGLRSMKSKQPHKIKVTKLSEFNAKKEEQKQEKTKEERDSFSIKQAQEKVNKAQKELEELKSQQRVKELQEKIAREREELEKLSK